MAVSLTGESVTYLHAVKHGWSMEPRHRVVRRSKYHDVKIGRSLFIACDDGSRICADCLGEIDGVRDQYGPAQKYGECYNCGLKVERY